MRWAGQLPEALEQINRTVLVDPRDATYQVEHARILFDLGRRDEAEGIALRTGLTWGWQPMYILGATGHRRELEAMSRNVKVSAEDKAYARLMLGDPKPMLAQLAGAGRPTRVNFKLWDSSFDALRDDPQFKAWLERNHLTAAQARAQDWHASRFRPAPTKTEAPAANVGSR